MAAAAEAEGEPFAPATGALRRLSKILQQLRERMSALMPAVRAGGGSRQQPPGRMQAFDDTLHQLIQLERRNHTLLQAVRAATHDKLQQLNQAKIKLKQLRRSYGFTRETALNSIPEAVMIPRRPAPAGDNPKPGRIPSMKQLLACAGEDAARHT